MNPERLRYTEDHEWIGEQDGLYVVGITDFAEEQLGSITYVELPEEGRDLHAGEDAGLVESVMEERDVYAPVSGRVVEINHVIEDSPEKVNQDPYGNGWFFKMEGVNPSDVEDLMDVRAYRLYCLDNAD